MKRAAAATRCTSVAGDPDAAGSAVQRAVLLNPQVDRLCMVCEMTISAQGRLSTAKFYEAVMSSHASPDL